MAALLGFLDSLSSGVAPRELPVPYQVDLTPEQEARRSALVERLHKLGGVPVDRGELMLESLAAQVEMREMKIANEATTNIKPHNPAQSGTPRGVFSGQPPVQIHVH